ncbi:MAG: hypothetical protein FJZ00_13150 [Candidatus Sericytochromatia bacterium]|uniref:Uncharacterized protein n=1 Tax=Candidatus Tanganyikabacteria bacterium TaxID=2961651 RepID=A0A938BP63_9BACT|nr:hypothetical protein [Candidatus Tanganyikabacteria bacterium]
MLAEASAESLGAGDSHPLARASKTADVDDVVLCVYPQIERRDPRIRRERGPDVG